MEARDSGGQLLLDQLRASLQVSRYSAASVLASLAVSLGGSIIAFILFLILRPRLKHLYSPNSMKKRSNLPYPGSGPFKWFRPLWETTESDLLETQGLDAVVFIRFLKMLRNLFIILAFLGCGIGIPINVVYNLRSPWASNLSKSDAFVMMTPSLVTGKTMLAHAVMGWVTNIVVITFLWREFKHILGMRKAIYSDPDHQLRLVNRTVLLTDLKKDIRSNKSLYALSSAFNATCAPSTVSLGTSVKHLERLIESHSEAVRQLEYHTLKYQKLQERHGGSAARPEVTPHRGSEKVDAIKYWGDLVDSLTNKIAQERYEARLEKKPLSYGFLTYAQQAIAHAIARDWRSKKHQGARIQLAPEPSDIIWPNIGLTALERASKQWWINVLFTALMIFWIVPNAFIGCFLTNLSRLAALWPAFGRAMDRSNVGFSILQGVLAPFVTSLVFMILPWIMRKLSRWQGKPTRNEREKEVIRKLYAFFFLINFFVFTLMGVIWDIIVQALSLSKEQHLTFDNVWETLEVPQRISTAIINISSFWVMYLLRANLGMFLELLQVITLTTRTWNLTFNTVTPRKRLEWMEAQPATYAVNYNWILFYMTVALGFTIIQPLCLLVMAFYFTLAVPLKKYSTMFMFYTKYESNGGYWPLLHNTVLFATAFGNLMLLCVIWVQAGWKIAMAAVPLPFVIIAYKLVAYMKFERHFVYFADEAERSMVFKNDHKEDLEEVFENPALNRPLDVPIFTLEDGLKAHEAQRRGSDDTIEKTLGSNESANDLYMRPSHLAQSSDNLAAAYRDDYGHAQYQTNHEHDPYRQASYDQGHGRDYEPYHGYQSGNPENYPPQYRVVQDPQSWNGLPYPQDHDDRYTTSQSSFQTDYDRFVPDNDRDRLL